MSDEQEVQEQQEENGLDPAVESEARAEGWRPLEEFDGPEERWVDAETFVKRGREINPILRKNNARLQKEVDALKSSLTQMESGIKSLQEYNAKIEQKAYDRAVKDIKRQRREALASGDNAGVAAAEEELEAIEELKPEAPVQQKKEEKADPALHPDFVAWMNENSSWFNDENPDLQDQANVVGMRLRRTRPELTGRAFLDAIKTEVVKKFPEHFGKRKSPAMAESGGGGASARAKSSSSLASLPVDIRSEAQQLVKEQWYIDLAKAKKLTPEQMYMQDYEG